MCVSLSDNYKVILNREEGKVVYVGLAHHRKDVVMKWGKDKKYLQWENRLPFGEMSRPL